MALIQTMQTMTSLAGIAMILLGSAWLKRFLRSQY